jgi:hypothetical protein
MRISLAGVSRPLLNYVAVVAVVITAGQTGRLENERWRAEPCPVHMVVKPDSRVVESGRVKDVERKDRFPTGQAQFWKLWIPQPQRVLQAIEDLRKVTPGLDL